MAITAAELAKMCNVSRMTVDRALKNKKGIKEETRLRILKVAEEYGYRPNFLASSLSTGTTHSIGIIVFDLYNQHFSYMVNAMESYLSEQGFLSYICISDKNPERERQLIDDLCDRKVDGIAFVPINLSSEFCDHVQAKGVPVVAVSNRLKGFPFVGGDGAAAVYSGMECFYNHGYRTIHFVCPPMRFKDQQNIYTQEDRLNGYLNFVKTHPEVHGEVITTSDYIDRLVRLVSDPKERPGVFCSSDHYTLMIRKRFIELGWDLDKCCYLMGFDGLDYLNHLTPRPTSVYYPAEDIGRAAARMLLNMIHGLPTEKEVLLPCPIMHGSVKM